MSLPDTFNSHGFLDPGTYEVTMEEIRNSLLLRGDGSSRTWDQDWRSHLLERAGVLIEQLRQMGVADIFLDGSFVEDKDHPNDIDGYFDPHLSMMNKADMESFEKLISDLNDLDPHKVWTWQSSSRKPYRGYPKKQLPMWHFYRVEFYPHLGQGTGIKDQQGHDLRFPSAFRQSRNGFKSKGIVKIINEVKND